VAQSLPLPGGERSISAEPKSGEGEIVLGTQGAEDHLHHAFKIFVDILIRDSQNKEALSFDEAGASLISSKLLCGTMGCAINFNDNLILKTCEVDRVDPNRMLAAKFPLLQLPRSQGAPKPGFGARL
jgi:hypothetical protein